MPSGSIYSFTQAQTELLNRMGRSTSQVDIYARSAVWLDSAQFKLATCTMATDWARTSSFTTSSGQAEYSLTNDMIPPITDCLGIYVVQCIDTVSIPTTTSKIKMRRRPWSEYRALSMQASSRPVFWSRWGTIIALDPNPNAGYTIQVDYKRRPTPGQVEIEPEYQEEWIKLAEFIGWQAMDQTDKAAQCMQMLPPLLQQKLSFPLSQDNQEATWDDDLAILPMSLDRSWPRG